MIEESNTEINGRVEETNLDLVNLSSQKKIDNDPILDLIQKYKSYISNTKMQDEVYKWELVKKFRGRPDTNAEDFANEYKSIKFGNLLYQLASGVGNHICRENPEEFRKLFVKLFNENSPLNDRINSFNVESLKLYRSIGGELGHHQDERSIATYLTLHNPEKYTFYKSTFYKEFCKLMGVSPVGKNEKYGHYLELINQFIENYIVPDTELTNTVKSYIPEYYDGKNHLLLAQDILYCMLNKADEDSNYWIFQGNLKIYDVVNALNDNALKSWSVKAHKDSIQIGDKVILWVSGNKAGCYALAEVTSGIFEAKDDESEMRYYVDSRLNEIANRVSIKITHNLASNPILKDQIQGIKDLSSLKVGSQGTNFKATKIEYNTFLKLAERNMTNRKYWLYAPGENASNWDEFYEKGIMGLGWDEIGDLTQYKSREELKTALIQAYGGEGSKKNDISANDDFINKVSIGDVVIVKKGRGELLGYGIVTSDYHYDKSREDFQKIRKIDWKLKGKWNVDFSLVLKTLTDITKYKSEHPDYNTFYERLLGIMGVGKTNKNYREDFIFWLVKKYGENSGTISSYIKAIDILSQILEKEIFTINDNQYLNSLYEDLLREQKNIRGKYYHSDAPSYGSNGFYSASIKSYNEFFTSLKTSMSNNNFINYPVNQILYGPPGTGKTYELKSSYFPKYISEESSLTAEQHFKNVVSECSWWQVLAVALIQTGKCKVNELANHKWVVQKAMLSNSNTIRATMWGQLQSHTVDNCEFVNVKSKQQPFIFNKTKDSQWEIVEEELKEKAPEIYELIDSVEKFSPRADKKFDRYFFTTFHQSYSYEDFIEGIKPVLENEESDGSVAYRIEDGIFKQICKKAEIDPENQYAIFIDEINRGNISAIFGELITLIEQDKRKGAENEMSVILPYSKKVFSVPRNLDIIGTMNTADRSVEALDTALRRRFSFVEMLPKPELLEDIEIEGIELKKLLETINERIEVLVDRDHTIGHAFFINDTTIEDLRNTFANKIIPLLQEYFYGDYSKMELVIGSAFFVKKEVSKVKFAVKSDDFEAEGQVYHIKNISDITVMSDEDFIKALNQLIGEED